MLREVVGIATKPIVPAVTALFWVAVEMDMVMNILAAELNASPDAVEKVRGRCIQHVKKTCGYISFRDAAEYQYRPPEEAEDEDE